jgi:hypothetical protein
LPFQVAAVSRAITSVLASRPSSAVRSAVSASANQAGVSPPSSATNGSRTMERAGAFSAGGVVARCQATKATPQAIGTSRAETASTRRRLGADAGSGIVFAAPTTASGASSPI